MFAWFYYTTEHQRILHILAQQKKVRPPYHNLMTLFVKAKQEIARCVA